MNVRNTIDLGNNHLIEIGEATWNDSEISIRNRYPTSNGGFSPHRSSEIPLGDLEPIMVAIAQRDLLDDATTARLIEALAASLARRVGTPAPPPPQQLLDRVTERNRHAEVETGPAVGNEAESDEEFTYQHVPFRKAGTRQVRYRAAKPLPPRRLTPDDLDIDDE